MLRTDSLSSLATAMRMLGTLSLERRRRAGRHSVANVPHEIRPSRRNVSHCFTYLWGRKEEGGRKGGMEGRKEGGREGGRERGREREMGVAEGGSYRISVKV